MRTRNAKSWWVWGVLVAFLTVAYSALIDRPDGESNTWWIWSVPLLFALLLYVIYQITKAIFGQKKEKAKKDPPDSDEENTTQPQAPVPQHTDDHGGSHGSSGDHGGGGHHGSSLLDRLGTLAFWALMAYGAYWLYQNIHSLEGKPNVRHPVQVMTAGPNPVPVGSRTIPQYHECSTKAPEGSTLYSKSESYSDAVVIPEGQTICDDSFKTGVRVRYLFHHPGMDTDQYDTAGYRRVDRAKISTDEDVHVWLEDL